MISDLFYAILGVCFLFCMTMLLIRSLHIFQLNSYKPAVQRKWVADNIFEWLIKTVWVVLALPAAKELGSFGFVFAAAPFLLVGLLWLPKKAKKPLVYTGRVKRLIFTLALICLACVLIGALEAGSRAKICIVMVFIALAAPYAVLAANFINRPVEKAINNRFINDAKRIIRDMPGLIVIGVTGSYGKTSVKFILGKLLTAGYETLVTPESYNTTLGVVRTVRERLRATHEIFICEMGARNPGDIREICDIVKPRCGVITSIGPQHLESFGTIENVIKTKFELADALPGDGVLFYNADNAYAAGRRVENAATVGYGTENGDWRASEISASARGTEFTVTGPDGVRMRLSTRLLGRHNVLNITGAVAAAVYLGVPVSDISAQVRRLDPVLHRLQLLGAPPRLIIDDAFNSNPEGAGAALETLSMFEGLHILVTPGMVELGKRQYELNRVFGEQAARVCDFVALVGEKQTQPILDGLRLAGFPEASVRVCDTLEDAIADADAFRQGTPRVILLENDLPDNY